MSAGNSAFKFVPRLAAQRRSAASGHHQQALPATATASVISRRALREGALVPIHGAIVIDLCALPQQQAGSGIIDSFASTLYLQLWMWATRQWRIATPYFIDQRGGRRGGGSGGAHSSNDGTVLKEATDVPRMPIVVPSDFAVRLEKAIHDRSARDPTFGQRLGSSNVGGQQKEQRSKVFVASSAIHLDAADMLGIPDPAAPPMPPLLAALEALFDDDFSVEAIETKREFLVLAASMQQQQQPPAPSRGAAKKGAAPSLSPITITPCAVDGFLNTLSCGTRRGESAEDAAHRVAVINAIFEGLSHPSYWKHFRQIMTRYAASNPALTNQQSAGSRSTSRMSVARFNKTGGGSGGGNRAQQNDGVANVELICDVSEQHVANSDGSLKSAIGGTPFMRVLQPVQAGSELRLHFGREWWTQHLAFQLFSAAPRVKDGQDQLKKEAEEEDERTVSALSATDDEEQEALKRAAMEEGNLAGEEDHLDDVEQADAAATEKKRVSKSELDVEDDDDVESEVEDEAALHDEDLFEQREAALKAEEERQLRSQQFDIGGGQQTKVASSHQQPKTNPDPLQHIRWIEPLLNDKDNDVGRPFPAVVPRKRASSPNKKGGGSSSAGASKPFELVDLVTRRKADAPAALAATVHRCITDIDFAKEFVSRWPPVASGASSTASKKKGEELHAIHDDVIPMRELRKMLRDDMVKEHRRGKKQNRRQ